MNPQPVKQLLSSRASFPPELPFAEMNVFSVPCFFEAESNFTEHLLQVFQASAFSQIALGQKPVPAVNIPIPTNI